MARFRGVVKGNRGETSRLGTGKSGLTVDCNGWDRGITVSAFVDPETGLDTFEIWITSGSGGGNRPRLLGRYV